MISAVWLVRSHQIAAELRYWLTFIGYDRRDRSLTHKIYLVYATLFFAVWGFATLSLLAGFAEGILAALSPRPLSLEFFHLTSIGVMVVVLLGWFLYTAFKAGQASPLTFNEDDAALICQTPVSRPAVALFWLLGDWIKTGPAFWAISVTLAFALQDLTLGSTVGIEHVPRYALAGLRALSMVLPLQWALMALAWSWGVLRLERDRSRRWWWLPPLLLGAVTLLGLLGWGGATLGLFAGAAVVPWLAPLALPLAAGYGLGEWAPGLLAGLGWAIVSSLALAFAARPLNLSRAAQESTGRSAGEAAAQAGNAQAAAEIALRRKLGTGHNATRLPGRPGPFALPWKTLLAWDRRGGWVGLGTIFVIASSGLGIALAPDWGTRAWAALAWLVAVEQWCGGPLGDDLRLWGLFRGLPVEGRWLLLGELAVPGGLVLALGLLAVIAAAVGPLGGYGLPAWALLLLPGAILSCGLAAAIDMLRSARSGRLLVGQAPAPGTSGVLIGGIVILLTGLAVQFAGGGASGYLAGALVSAVGSWLLLEIATDALDKIE